MNNYKLLKEQYDTIFKHKSTDDKTTTNYKDDTETKTTTNYKEEKTTDYKESNNYKYNYYPTNNDVNIPKYDFNYNIKETLKYWNDNSGNIVTSTMFQSI
jgi:hypothetical protein